MDSFHGNEGERNREESCAERKDCIRGWKGRLNLILIYPIYVRGVNISLFKVLSQPGDGMQILKPLTSPRHSISSKTPEKMRESEFKFPVHILPQFSSELNIGSTRSPSPDLDSQLQGSWTLKNVVSVDQFTRGQVFMCDTKLVIVHWFTPNFLSSMSCSSCRMRCA